MARYHALLGVGRFFCGIAGVAVATAAAKRFGKRKALVAALGLGVAAYGASWRLFTPGRPWLYLLDTSITVICSTGLPVRVRRGAGRPCVLACGDKDHSTMRVAGKLRNAPDRSCSGRRRPAHDRTATELRSGRRLRCRPMIVHDNATAAGTPRGRDATPQNPPMASRPRSAEAKLLALLAAENARIERHDDGEYPAELADVAFPGCPPLALEPNRDPETRIRKLRTLPVETAIIERHRRGESTVEEVLLALYHAGTSLGGIERICDVLWGARISPATISELSKRTAAQIAASLGRCNLGVFPYVFLSSLAIRRGSGAEIDEVSVAVAVGVDGEGFRSLLGVCVAAHPRDCQWHRLLDDLARRGATGVRLFIGDAAPDMRAAVAAVFPGARFQQCVMRFYRSVAALVPGARQRSVTTMLKAVHASEDRPAARAKAAQVAAKLDEHGLAAAAADIRARAEETFSFYGFPSQHWHSLQSANRIEKILRDIRERARVVGAFSDEESAAVMVAARFRALAAGAWHRKGFMNMTRLGRELAEPVVETG